MPQPAGVSVCSSVNCSLVNVVMGQPYQIRILKSVSEIDEVEDLWASWQRHPNTSFDLFRLVLETRADVIRPNVLVLSRNGATEGLVLCRLEEGHLPIKIGYLTLWTPHIRSLVVLHEGSLGEITQEAAVAVVQTLMRELASGVADRVYLSHQREDSLIAKAAQHLPGLLSRDHAIVKTVHRSMKLPNEPGAFLGRMRSKHRSWIKGKGREM